MELIEVEKHAKALMMQHGLGRLLFEFDNGKRRLGAMHYRRVDGIAIPVKITLSKHYAVLLPAEELRDVMLHEIAHALAPGHGHDAVWRMQARKIGASGNRCATPSAKPAHSIEGWCPECDVKVSEHHRMPSRTYVHRGCRTVLEYIRV